MTSRRIRVRRNDQRAVIAIGALAGVGLALDGLRPTGSVTVDCLLLVLVGVGAIWASASAPWWTLSVVAGVAATLAPPVVPLLVGLGVFALSLGVGLTRRSQPIVRAAVAGGAILVLAMARELHWFGLNSLMAICLIMALGGLGLTRRSARERRPAILIVGVIAAVAVVGVLGLLLAGTSARPDLTEGNRTARQGLRQLKSGDFELARASFDRAAAAFDRAHGDLAAAWVQPARLVPVASQHWRTGVAVAEAAALTTRSIEQQLRLVDLDALRIVDGRIDLDAVRALREPMAEVQAALNDLEVTVAASRSGWLVAPIQAELDKLADDIDQQQQLGEKAVAALDVAPAILGADGKRVYFVMFTTPAEARGQGGFMGNYAEITIDEGAIEMTAFGRHRGLNEAGVRPRVLRHAPADWLARYGQFGYQNGVDGTVGQVPWSNITISPNFPATAQVVSELYPQSGGQPIDGVISLDVYAMEQLVGLVSPIRLAQVPEPLTVNNTAEFLIIDQYRVGGNADRVDLLESVARATIDRLLNTRPPDPLALGRALAPMAQQRRLYAWSSHEAEEAVITAAGMDGTLLGNLDGREGVAVAVVNGSASKIDSFLERSFEYVSDDEGDRLVLTLTNTAPASGLPDYVIGNAVGMPPGWSRLWLTVNSTRLVEAAFRDGAEYALTPGVEAGVNTYSNFVDLGPGATSRIELHLGPADLRAARELVLQPQPLWRQEVWKIEHGSGNDQAITLDVRSVVDLSP